MLGTRVSLGKKTKEDGERPFWISFADLMSALMVLFLLVMSVALLAVTKTITDAERKKEEREQDINQLLTQIEAATRRFEIKIDRDRKVVDFKERALFATGSSELSDDQAVLLRAVVPEILKIARNKLGEKWLKRIVVEGFADKRGDYLLNLNLSLQRSQRVLCVLLDKPNDQERPMTSSELGQVRDLFLVGGYSFNSAKDSLEESRRIELRLEFFAIDDIRPNRNAAPAGNFGSCRI